MLQSLKLIVMTLLLGLSACASTQEEIDHFGFAASTPLRDMNIGAPPIPGQLSALSHPYGRAGPATCEAWRREVVALQHSIKANEGRRVGFRRSNRTFEGRTGNLRDSGVKVAATAFLPFRSVVRQVSGAARLEQEANLASDRARFRIGYLVGTARGAGCPGFIPARQPHHYGRAHPSAASVPHGRVPPR